MKVSIITAFPQAFSFLDYSIPKRAQEKGQVSIEIVDLKEFGLGRWKKIDDKPFGGGHGMVLTIEPVYRALQSIVPERMAQSIDSPDEPPLYKTLPESTAINKTMILLMSARGSTWNQEFASSFSQQVEHVVLICGHYEGFDHRILHFVDAEVSVGDFILSGGELAAMTITDSIIRLLPNVLGNDFSAIEETAFTPASRKKVIEHPHYTRPEIFTTDIGQSLPVPSVLLSGNHAAIDAWRVEQSTTLSI